MTDAERQELYTLMQQWGRNDDIRYQKVREWVEAKLDALQSERDALSESLERLLAEAQEVEHIRCLQVVEGQISRFTGPTGGWVDSPKEVFAEIALHMLHRVVERSRNA